MMSDRYSVVCQLTKCVHIRKLPVASLELVEVRSRVCKRLTQSDRLQSRSLLPHLC
jgi:hypothetical protein